MGMFGRAPTIAHYIVLERLLARTLDPEALAALKADCLGIEDNVYRQGGINHDEFQAVLAHIEGLFASAAQVQREAGAGKG